MAVEGYIFQPAMTLQFAEVACMLVLREPPPHLTPRTRCLSSALILVVGAGLAGVAVGEQGVGRGGGATALSRERRQR